MQQLVLQDARDFVQWLKSEEGQSISMNRKFTIATINSLWSIMTNTRYPQNDPDIANFLDTGTK